jgi:FkbM family methyltransferase
MAGLIRPILAPLVKHCHRMLKDKNYRYFHLLAWRLQFKKRHEVCKLKLHNYELKVPDWMSFVYQYEEIFVKQSYHFNTKSEAPRILDLGSNLGTSLLYYKENYPQAIIDAYEPDPKVFECLKHNVENNNLQGINLNQKAAWINHKGVCFTSTGADDGRISEEGVSVETIDVKNLLNKYQYDFVKMDIEGAETEVLMHCGESLGRVNNLFIEYHLRPDETEKLGQCLGLLEKCGFRYTIQEIYSPQSYFTSCDLNHGFEMQVNIFAKKLFREDESQ